MQSVHTKKLTAVKLVVVVEIALRHIDEREAEGAHACKIKTHAIETIINITCNNTALVQVEAWQSGV